MLTKETATALRKDMKAALEAVAEKHGVKLVSTSCSYTEITMNVPFKIESPTVVSGVEVDTDMALFLSRCGEYGLSRSDLGREVQINGTGYVLSGLKPQNVKYPILAMRSWDGRSFKFTARDVVAAIRAESVAA
jgi:hypothetical protein